MKLSEIRDEPSTIIITESKGKKWAEVVRVHNRWNIGEDNDYDILSFKDGRLTGMSSGLTWSKCPRSR